MAVEPVRWVICSASITCTVETCYHRLLHRYNGAACGTNSCGGAGRDKKGVIRKIKCNDMLDVDDIFEGLEL